MKIQLQKLDEFLLNLKNDNYSNETLENYERDLRAFERYLNINNIEFKDLKKIHIAEYKGFLRSGKHSELFGGGDDDEIVKIEDSDEENNEKAQLTGVKEESSFKPSKTNEKNKTELSPRSVNRMLSSLRSYLRFLIEFDYESPIIPDSVKLIKTEKKEKQIPELDEMTKLIEAPNIYESNPKIILRNRAILELLFSTGMRISEICNLNRDQLTIDSSGNVSVGKIYILGKGKKQRFVYLTPRCIVHLSEYLKTRDDDLPALFIPYKGTRKANSASKNIRISTNYLQMKIIEYRRRLGIIVPTSAHSLRHGFATFLAENGANSAAIQILLGHESLATTTRYVHASDKFAESIHKKFHPLQNDEDDKKIMGSDTRDSKVSDPVFEGETNEG